MLYFDCFFYRALEVDEEVSVVVEAAVVEEASVAVVIIYYLFMIENGYLINCNSSQFLLSHSISISEFCILKMIFKQKISQGI